MNIEAWKSPTLRDHYAERRAHWIRAYRDNTGLYTRKICREWALFYSSLVRCS